MKKILLLTATLTLLLSSTVSIACDNGQVSGDRTTLSTPAAPAGQPAEGSEVSL